MSKGAIRRLVRKLGSVGLGFLTLSMSSAQNIPAIVSPDSLVSGHPYHAIGRLTHAGIGLAESGTGTAFVAEHPRLLISAAHCFIDIDPRKPGFARPYDGTFRFHRRMHSEGTTLVPGTGPNPVQIRCIWTFSGENGYAALLQKHAAAGADGPCCYDDTFGADAALAIGYEPFTISGEPPLRLRSSGLADPALPKRIVGYPYSWNSSGLINRRPYKMRQTDVILDDIFRSEGPGYSVVDEASWLQFPSLIIARGNSGGPLLVRDGDSWAAAGIVVSGENRLIPETTLTLMKPGVRIVDSDLMDILVKPAMEVAQAAENWSQTTNVTAEIGKSFTFQLPPLPLNVTNAVYSLVKVGGSLSESWLSIQNGRLTGIPPAAGLLDIEVMAHFNVPGVEMNEVVTNGCALRKRVQFLVGGNNLCDGGAQNVVWLKRKDLVLDDEELDKLVVLARRRVVGEEYRGARWAWSDCSDPSIGGGEFLPVTYDCPIELARFPFLGNQSSAQRTIAIEYYPQDGDDGGLVHPTTLNVDLEVLTAKRFTLTPNNQAHSGPLEWGASHSFHVSGTGIYDDWSVVGGVTLVYTGSDLDFIEIVGPDEVSLPTQEEIFAWAANPLSEEANPWTARYGIRVHFEDGEVREYNIQEIVSGWVTFTTSDDLMTLPGTELFNGTPDKADGGFRDVDETLTAPGGPCWMPVGSMPNDFGRLSGFRWRGLGGAPDLTITATFTDGERIRTATKVVRLLDSEAPCDPVPALDYLQAPPSGGVFTVQVAADADCAWMTTESADWVTFVGDSSGNGNGSITLQVAANTGFPDRWTLVALGERTILVEQQGTFTPVTPSTTQLSATCQAADLSVPVQAAVEQSWTAFAVDPWIEILDGPYHTGATLLRVRVAAHSESISRSGRILVEGTEVTVTQASCDGGGGPTLVPEIVIEEPVGFSLTDGSSVIPFGSVTLGGSAQRVFTIRNTGSANLTGAVAQVGGANPADFVITSSPSGALAPGASTTFTVRFSPTATGLRSSALQVFSNDADESPFDIGLAGTGLGVPEIAVEYPVGENLVDGISSVAFGTVAVGSESQRTFTIRNLGSSGLTVVALDVVGLNASDFNATTFPTATILPGASTTITLRFAPRASGVRTALLQIASNDPNESPFDIVLSGSGSVAPEILVEHPIGESLADGEATVNFGSAVVGTNNQRTLVIRNAGTSNLIDISATVVGDAGDEFQVTTTPATLVAPGGSTTVTLSFAPVTAGLKSALLRILSSDADESPFDVNLTGSGQSPGGNPSGPELVVQQPVGIELVDGISQVDFGSAWLSASVQRSFIVRNVGDASLTGVGVTLAGVGASNFSLTTGPSATIPPQGEAIFVVSFSPSAPGLLEANLRILSNDPDESPFDILLRGNGVTRPDVDAVRDFLEWYRADSEQFAGLTNGQPVVNWRPEAGSSANPVLVQAAGNEIIYRRSVPSLNEQPALEFPGGPSAINNIGTINFNGVSLFLVFRNIGSGQLQRAVGGIDSNTLLGPWNPSQAGRYSPTIHLNGAWKIHPNDGTGWVDPAPCVLSIVLDDLAVERSYINGVEINSGAGQAGPMDTAAIGRLSFGGAVGTYSEPYTGYIAEFIIYRRVLSEVETREVHDYLLTKYGLTPTDPQAPLITRQPTSLTLAEGTNAAFRVSTLGSGPFTYAWRRNGVPITNDGKVSGALTDTLTLNPIGPENAGSYDVVVSDARGSVTSRVARLIVQSASSARLTVREQFTNGLTLQLSGGAGSAWQILEASRIIGPWVAVGTVTADPNGNATFGYSSTSGEERYFRAVEGGGTVPLLLSPPVSLQVPSFSPAEFAIGAAGGLPLHFQWRHNGVILTNGGVVAGANSPTLNLSAVQMANAGTYDVIISNSSGTVTSSPATLEVISRPPPARIIGVTPSATSELVSHGRVAANTVNGVYLDSYFWESVGIVEGFGVDRDPAITFDLGRVVSLDRLTIWNGHEPPASIRRMMILVSLDGSNFSPLKEVLLTKLAPTAEDIALDGVEAKFVRLDILENGSGVTYPVVGKPSGWSLVAIDEIEFYGW